MNQKNLEIKRAKVTEFEIVLPYPYKNANPAIGVDPGSRNLGICIIHPTVETLIAYRVQVDKINDAVQRMANLQRITAEIIERYEIARASAIIEGASYWMKYGQVELAEARGAIALMLYGMGIGVAIVPPRTIRKKVFGNGKIINPWNIQDDVAASMGCAYYLAR